MTKTSFAALVSDEWSRFRRGRVRMAAVAVGVLVVVLAGVVPAYSDRAECWVENVEVACPRDPVGPDGDLVEDKFFYGHQTLTGDGSITARLTSMTGTITYPPPDHDEIVPGLVPWAKAGIIVKDGTARGSAYAAVMMTGAKGVRMQYDYDTDIAGTPGGVSPEAPRWFRLARAGNTVTGYESADGRAWTELGSVELPELGADATIGLFATSPGDLTRRPVGLGGTIGEARFTQASGVFDGVAVEGADGTWTGEAVGTMGSTDWEKYHLAPGFAEVDGTFTVTGSGDIGPVGEMGGHTPESTLTGLIALMLVLMVVAAVFVGGRAGSRAVLGARAIVVGGVAFAAGLVAAVATVLASTAVMRGEGTVVYPVGVLTEVRVVLAAAFLTGATAVLAVGLRGLLRGVLALSAAVGLVVLPYAFGVIPYLPDDVSAWLLRLTPAGGFAMLQSLVAHPQVTANYVASAGYFPLPGWAGCLVLGGYAALALWSAARRLGPGTASAEWR
ncbi:hypothetical protein [Phytomonospora endophytica]|uniref:DUF1349 domain-containing protein n=1 Tax=Phytomonospora endophytica TaxID=714109 RepID=A0A841FLS8_9ACTN|nr:hypothetical protein [Phytomonospora endophytica]MBB6036814.1 hypothetical protein [Phytomonospora endophytica]GIG68152.1 hypothetical protein Pen01_44470 [Phytomonospora endophytica]